MTVFTATPLDNRAAVRLEVTGAPAGPVTLTRTDVNGIRDVRRIAGQQPVGGFMLVTDYEAALAGPVTYRLTTALDITTQVIAGPALPGPVLSLPVLPSRSTRPASIGEYVETSASPGSEHPVIGRADSIFIGTGPAGLRSGRFTVWCAGYADARAIRDLIQGPGEVAMLRQPEHAGLDMYLRIRSVDVAHAPRMVIDPTTGTPVLRWTAVVSYLEVAPPTDPLAAGAGWTVADLAQLLEAVADVPLAFATVRDLAVGP